MNNVINQTYRSRGNFSSKEMFGLFFSLWWMRDTVLAFVAPVFRALPIIGSFGNYVIPIMLLVTLFFSLPYILGQLRYSDILFYLVVVLTIIGTMLFMPENGRYIQSQFWRIIGSSVAVYFLGVACDHEYLKKPLYWCSLGSVLLLFAYQFYQLLQGRALATDNMDASYNVLASVLYLFYYAMEKKGLRFWIMPAVGFLLILSYGTRGPVVVILAFLFAALFMKNIWMRRGWKRGTSAFLMFLALVLLFSTDIILQIAVFLGELFHDIGFSTRVLGMFVVGEITNSSGRDTINDVIYNAIWEKPIFGHGLMGDRILLNARGNAYAHNIFLEMWLDFGVIFGTILFLSVIYRAATAIIKKRNDCYFVLMIVVMALVKLFFTSSYIIEPYFFLMLGVCARSVRHVPRRFVLQNPGNRR